MESEHTPKGVRNLPKCFSVVETSFVNWNSLYARLNNHYEAWNYKKKSTKRLKYTGNLFRNNLQLKDIC